MYANLSGRRWLCVSTALALVACVGLSFAQEQKKPEPPKAPKTIVDVAKDTANLKTFCKLLASSGLAETLEGKGPFTVFAPTDEAFDKLGKEKLDDLQKPENKAKLQKVLKHHVVDGKHTAADVQKMKTAKTLAGDELTITVKDGVVMIGPAKVTMADVEGSNGLIHLVDTVIMPAE